MNGVGAKPEKVLAGVDRALEVGLGVKINAVIKKGVNEQEVLPLARLGRERGIPVRFIEYMDTGNSNRWKLGEVVSSEQLLSQIQHEIPLQPLEALHRGETAVRYGVSGEEGFEVGFISSVTKPFCLDCNRMRLSAEGKLYACLFAAEGLDIKTLLRQGDGEGMERAIKGFWNVREDRYSMLRAEGVTLPKQEMSYMGG
jgi:cyclic pyranopterin phosphate synthase